MAYYVSDLLVDPSLSVTSLTPGVGEGREITWAHVCELPDPWNWMGTGGLLMTTGIPIPGEDAAQGALVQKCHDAGIAAILIADGMSAPPITAAMFKAAEVLKFPILSTEAAQPYTAIAKAVASAVLRQTELRLTTAERMYKLLNDHLTNDDIAPLLKGIGDLLNGSLRLMRKSDERLVNTHSRMSADEWKSVIPLSASHELVLEYVPRSAGGPDRDLLQYVSTTVSAFLAIQTSHRRSQSSRGSLILSRLIDGVVDQQTGQELVETYGLKPSFRILTWRTSDSVKGIESLLDGLLTAKVPHLATTRDNLMVLLIGEESQTMEKLSQLVYPDKVGASAPFTTMSSFRESLRQSRISLDFPSRDSWNLYENLRGLSPFLSNDTELLAATALEILKPIMVYDEERNTELLMTLKVFLEEDRNWSRTAERLHVHRQTLYARVSRIENVTKMDLSSVAVISDFWMALQAASSLGLLGR